MKESNRIYRCDKIYTEEGPVNGYLIVQDGKIVRITTDRYRDAVDCIGEMIIPGIVDTHNHASFGYSPDGKNLEEAEKNTLRYLKALPVVGVTSVFPTLFATEPDEASLLSLKVLGEICGKPVDGAKALAIHFEGPFLNRTGEHVDRYQVKPIDMEYVKKCFELSKGHLKLMGLAPELSGSEELIDYLGEHGCTAAMAHSDADSVMAFHSFENGITTATHTCNVMVGIHHREVGGLGAALLDNRVYCELICDGLHVCNDMLKLILKVKPHDKIILISDSSSFVGMPEGKYSREGEGIITVDSFGRVMNEEGGLNGSSKGVLFGIRNLVLNNGEDLSDILKMACLNPCVHYGFDEHKGSLREGKDADFVRITHDFEVLETYSEGRCIYSREMEFDPVNPELMRRKLREE